jgi:HSP20 family protein
MADVPVQKVAQPDDRRLPIFEEMDRLMARIRERAFGLSRERGFLPERALDDWLAAEREECWPSAELVERDKEFALSVALPGFEAGEVTVTATARELIVHAKHERSRESKKGEQTVWSEFRSDDVYRRVELPRDIDVGTASASLQNGVLTVVARKLEKPARAVPVAAAA